MVDFANAAAVEDQILEALLNYEPRIDNIDVVVDPKPDTNEYEVTVSYEIIGQEFPPQTYTFILEATR